MNINRLGPPQKGTLAGYGQISAVLAVAVADPLYAVEQRNLVRQRARAKGRGEATPELDARLELVGSRLNFYDDLWAGFSGGYIAVTPVRGEFPDYDYVAPPPTPEVVAEAVPVFGGTITEVGLLLGEAGAKGVELEVKQGAGFEVVKQAPEAGAARPSDGIYGLGVKAPADWVNHPVVLISQVYRLAPEWLGVADYAATSEAVEAAIVKVIGPGEIARLATDGDKMIAGWAPKILKTAGVSVGVDVVKAALKFAVGFVK